MKAFNFIIYKNKISYRFYYQTQLDKPKLFFVVIIPKRRKTKVFYTPGGTLSAKSQMHVTFIPAHNDPHEGWGCAWGTSTSYIVN